MTDEEKLNDLKNRISFALKDATLQQGFEIICKRIADLEKTVEELQFNLRSRNDLVEELTMQIEGMKCCGNCRKELVCIKAEEMNICEEWEFEK